MDAVRYTDVINAAKARHGLWSSRYFTRKYHPDKMARVAAARTIRCRVCLPIMAAGMIKATRKARHATRKAGRTLNKLVRVVAGFMEIKVALPQTVPQERRK